MMSTPEISRSVSRFSPSVSPRPVAVMPSATNIALNERQKMTAGQQNLEPRLAGLDLGELEPEIAER